MAPLLLIAVLSLLVLPAVHSANYITKYIDVPIDHFSFTNNATFRLKYLINDTYWVNDGPIFFYTGNEGTIENFAENTGFMFDIAPSFNALLVFAEHRYYGTSLPFGNLSYTGLEHLGYLTSTQALADYVFLISSLQQSYGNVDHPHHKVPVVAFGGSYGGMLAAYLRMKYPSSVIGAIASSAPIWQFDGLVPCGTFYQIVADVYQNSNPQVVGDCSKPLKNTWKTIRNLTLNETGKTWLANEWKLCSPLKSPQDVETLINWVSGILVNMVMVNYPYPTSFLSPLPENPVNHFCEKLSGAENYTNEKLLQALGEALQIYTNFTETTTCNNINVTASDLGETGWNFQACTEMIMPMCSKDSIVEDSEWDFAKFAEDCHNEFGVRPLRADLPILEYGGKDIASASNIVFSNGLLDPWSSGGVLKNVSATVVAILIPESAHHLDLRARNELDPKSVLEARRLHQVYIENWIKEHYRDYYKDLYVDNPFYKRIENVGHSDNDIYV